MVFAAALFWFLVFAHPILSAQVPEQSKHTSESSQHHSIVQAAEYGTHKEVLSFLRTGANPDQRGFRGTTALMMAAKRGLFETVQILLRAGARVNARDDLGRTPLMFAASSGNLETLKAILAKHPAVNETDKNGDTALMAAAAAGVPELVQELLKLGARVNPADHSGRTALITGARGEDGMKETEFGRPWGEFSDTLIHRDIVIRLLLDAGANIGARDVDGETALFTLEEDAVHELISHKADVNARNNQRVTPLIKITSDAIAKMLIDAGADKNAADGQGRTALIQAAGDGDLAKVRVLLRAGANRHIKDSSGSTALDTAQTGLKQAKQGLKAEAYRQIIDLLQEP